MKNTKKTILALVSAILVGGIFYGFHFVASGENYLAHRTVRRSLVDHPEFIPTERTVRVGSMGMETLVADFYWLSAIQYIGSNAVSAEYKGYLGVMLNLVTDLSPHFTYPYNIGMLLIPDVNQRYETLTADDEKHHIEEALALGKKGIEKNCDGAKIAKIAQTFDLQKLYSDESLMEPCADPMIPYYLGYVAYWNDNDPVAASLWFRVAGTHAAAPRGARLMSAIMQGKTGNREKAIIMFLSLAESVDNKPDSTCRKVVGELRNLLAPAFDQGAKLTPGFLKQIEQVRQNAKKELGDKQEEIDRTDVSAYCSSYLDKSVREMNLQYVQDADDRYFADKGRHAKNAKTLLDEKYITYLPKDYQQQSKENEIIYFYNEKTKGWDFEMGKY